MFNFFASLFIIIIFIVILSPIYFSVLAEEKKVSEELKKFENSSSGTGIKSIETETSSLNRLFKDIIRRGAADRNVSGIIDRLVSDSDNKILFFSISYRKNKEIYITGFSPTRQDLISFEKKLREYGNLKEISSPVSNLIKEANINFSIRAIPTF